MGENSQRPASHFNRSIRGSLQAIPLVAMITVTSHEGQIESLAGSI